MAASRQQALIVIVVFAVVYACSLTFGYVEGDDASTVAYHALGRRGGVQRPYSAYHGMMDAGLRRLPAHEPTLRYAAIAASAIAAPLLVILSLRLAAAWTPALQRRTTLLLPAVIGLAMPELFFLGMMYTPSLVAMALVLAAHLLARRAAGWPGLAASAAVFGVGVACRWDAIIYAMVVAGDLALLRSAPGSGALHRAWRGASWLILSVAAAALAIGATGAGLAQVRYVIALAAEEVSVQRSLLFAGGVFQTLFSAAAIALILAGFVALLRSRPWAALLAVALLPLLAPYLASREPKMFLPAVPGLIVCVAAGTERILRLTGRSGATAVGALAVLLIAPWLTGVRIASTDTAWGPGFDVRTVDPEGTGRAPLAIGSVGTREVAASSIGLTFGAGVALPTPEGPRPLGGFGAVLLGGGWRRLINKVNDEHRRIVDAAVAQRIPIVQDNRNAYVLLVLVQRGYSTNDPREHTQAEGFVEREFANARGERIRILYQAARRPLTHDADIDSLSRASRSRAIVFFTNFSSSLTTLRRLAPEAVSPIGPFSARVDLPALRAAAGHHDR